MVVSLDLEFTAAVRNFRKDSRDALASRYSVPSTAGFRVPGATLGVARIETNGSLYQPSETGQGAIIMVTAIVAGGGLEDLLAFRPSAPDEWWFRKGAARWLGEWELGRRMVTAPVNIEPPALMSPCRADDPLHVFSTPLDWLRNACDGCVPLTRGAYADLVNIQAPLTFEDVGHHKKAQQLMCRPVDLPESFVRVQELAA
jgi:hypothetical protein